MHNNDNRITDLEKQVGQSSAVEQMISSDGWKVYSDYVTKHYEQKILDTFRRIPGNSHYDAGFRILQGEYQMLQHILRIPYEIMEIGEQAKKRIESIESAEKNPN